MKKYAQPLAAAVLLSFWSGVGAHAADSIRPKEATHSLGSHDIPAPSQAGGATVRVQPAEGMLALNRTSGSPYVLPVGSAGRVGNGQGDTQTPAGGESEHGALIFAGLLMVGVVVSKRLMR